MRITAVVFIIPHPGTLALSTHFVPPVKNQKTRLSCYTIQYGTAKYSYLSPEQKLAGAIVILLILICGSFLLVQLKNAAARKTTSSL